MASSNNPTTNPLLLTTTATIDSALCSSNTSPVPAPQPSLISYYELILEELRQAAAAVDVDVDVDDTSGGRFTKFQQILVNYENSTTTKKKEKKSSTVGVGVDEKKLSLVEKNKEGVDVVVDVDAVVLEVAAAADVVAETETETETETEIETDFFEFQPSYLTDVLVKRLLVPVISVPGTSSSSCSDTN
ncbi:hypothetical protein FRACYDRAFT_250597 [Fragilariopsis cylindrus CCMP1102]|uniref:Uncharacterized protein n=1 Tax=Fragilariopsis cylindrus CCMP1102 TaxID=635003 RepID=A0A1E7EQ75_9STRA|nr:hypothetical protein FRACYDRAFT_250597 [Fragilariopsis cylindrus CCMP1102]|eukprot:OEU07946.1 hypothetical protein FRACYDRAFT_250597 [Fragilariopsis cylindrus CCMP1102]